MAQGDYVGISIREALKRINAPDNGWYLPITQRQFVWGARESSEGYICLLVDSLLRGFPIGGLILWETTKPVDYRRFHTDYSVGSVEMHADPSTKEANKFLVYDGQQRLQTLYSVLYYTFNGRTLYFDLTFDFEKREIDETGFSFLNSHEQNINNNNPIISMPFLLRQSDSMSRKIEIEDLLLQGKEYSPELRKLIRINFGKLWDVFVADTIKSIAYFPVRSDKSDAVNEVFRRLNTGGIPLNQLELVLSKIKEVSPYFEERLWDLSRIIKKETGGYEFVSYEIVQIIYLLVFKTARVDSTRLKDKQKIDEMIRMLEDVKVVLPHFFKVFLFERFRINAKWLIARQQALLPLLVYCIILRNRGYYWEITKIDTRPLVTYFIKSQLCDWNTQTMVTLFSNLAMNAAENNRAFPLEEIAKNVKNRTSEVYSYQLESARWFSLKILTPNRQYIFAGRKPEIDHIFPQALHDKLPDNKEYRQRVDVLWNLQPVPAEFNNYKRTKCPVDFFKSDDGRKFLTSYDFLPQSLEDEAWNNEEAFIEFRKKKMIEFLKDKYGIELMPNPIPQESSNN